MAKKTLPGPKLRRFDFIFSSENFIGVTSMLHYSLIF